MDIYRGSKAIAGSIRSNKYSKEREAAPIDKETGLTVEPENVEQLTKAIKELINNDELRLQYGRNARKRVKDLFDIEKIKELYKEFYNA